MKNIIIILAFFSLSLSAQDNKLWLYNGKTVIFQGSTAVSQDFSWLYDISLHNTDTIPIIAGAYYELQSDEISQVPIGKNEYVTYEYTSEIGTYEPMTDSLINNTIFQRSGKYIIDSATYIGHHNLNIKAKRGNTTYGEINKVLKVFTNSNGLGENDTNTVMFVGNSITTQGENSQIDSVRKSLVGITPLMVGTFGTAPNNHAAVSGYTYLRYLGSDSPFWNGSEIDINGYRVDSLGLSEPVDYAIINLGVNDVIGSTIDTSDITNDILPRIDSLISKFKADTTKHIIIACPTISENSGTGWYANYGDADQNYFGEKIIYLREKIIERYGNFSHDTNVYVSMHANYLDRDEGYPVDGSGNHSNGVHPSTGQYSIANAVTASVENILYDDKAELLSNPFFDSTSWADLATPNNYPLGWALINNDADNYVEPAPNNSLRFYSTTNSVFICGQLTALEIGKDYRVTVVVDDYTSGAVRIRQGGATTYLNVASKGVHIAEFTSIAVQFYLQTLSMPVEMNISYVSCVEIE